MSGNDHRAGFEEQWGNPVTRRRLLSAAGLGVAALTISGKTMGARPDAAIGARARSSPTMTGVRPHAGAASSFAGAFAHPFLELDPVVQTAFGTVIVTDYVHGVLYRLDPFPPRTDLTPELATAMPTELDPTRYRISLREGVTFHDGGAFTADDVVFTIGRIKDPDNNSLFQRFFDLVDEIEATGDHELEVQLASPTTLLAQLLSLVKIQSRAAVEASGDALDLAPVGTGPYRVATAVSGQEITLHRFDGYAGPREFTYDDITFAVASDPNARVSGVRSGSWKAIDEVPTSTFEGLASASGLAADAVDGYHQVDLLFNCGRPPFDDARVRRAVMYAIDRDTITDTSFFGQAIPAWAGHVAPDHPSFTLPERIYEYDPDQARALLGEVGLGDDPIDIEFLFANDVEVIRAQQPVVEQNLQDIGFRPDVTPGAQESLYSYVADGSFDVLLASRDPSALGISDAVLLLRLLFTGAFPRQLLHWDGDGLARMEAMSDAAISTRDPAELDALLGDMVALMQDEVPLAPLHFKRQLTAWSESLEGFRPLPTVGLSLEGVRG